MPTLYLALTLTGLFVEMGHGFGHRLDPLTICSYTVDVDGIADLRTEPDRAALGVSVDDMACAWSLDLANGRRPASWIVAENLMASGASGLLTPSFARGANSEMTNLVLWRWGPDLPYRVSVHDPSGRLPHNPSSWSSGAG